MEWGGACIHGGKLLRAQQQTRLRQASLQAQRRDTGQAAAGQPLTDQGTGQGQGPTEEVHEGSGEVPGVSPAEGPLSQAPVCLTT